MSPNSEAKQYKITYQRCPDYLKAYVEGRRDTVEISLAYWKEVGEECRRLDLRKVLVEEDLPELGSFAEMYEVASRLPQILPGVVIAFVDRHTDQAELNAFGELVAQNCGVSGRFFSDREEAEEWIRRQ